MTSARAARQASLPNARRLRAIPRPEKRSPTLPTAVVGKPAARAASSTVGAGGRTAKSLRSRVRTKPPPGPGERARDDPPHLDVAGEHRPGRGAPVVELGDGDRVDVGGHLEDTVRGGVDNRLARGTGLLAERLEDLGAGGDDIAEARPADAALERFDDLGR